MVWVSLEPIILSVSSQDRPGRAEVQTHANTLQYTHTQTHGEEEHTLRHEHTHRYVHIQYTHTLTMNIKIHLHIHIQETACILYICIVWISVHTYAVTGYHSSPQGQRRSPF